MSLSTRHGDRLAPLLRVLEMIDLSIAGYRQEPDNHATAVISGLEEARDIVETEANRFR